MFKKIGFATVFSAALLFGGTFATNVDAQSNYQVNTKVYYSTNGNFSQQDIQNYLDKYFSNYKIQWKQQQTQETQQQDKAEKPEQQPTQQPQKQAEEQPQQQAEQQQTVEKDQQASEDNGQDQQLNQFEQEVVELTNEERAKNGLSPLKIDNELSKVAREKSSDMAENGYFSHNSPTYGSPFDMMKQFGISYNTAGENIAKGQRSPEEVVEAWMNSEGHRKNILNADFTHIGVGYVEQGNVWTQQFIGK
ncbi:CAP domain-containing protein [Sediminibacillus massiliensis]|uniref:CAP domain-containing protein n=1 Tax=Sediminibacillus massiliensis TaxID=1926277 RepID=UPI0009883E5B|nr:CAP domain-containing protein [Sediminibacillus massiliensis]